MDDDPGQHWANLMELVLKGGDAAEVPAAAPHAPEEVCMLGGAGREPLAVGRDEIDREEVIRGQAVRPGQVAPTATKGQAGDASRGDLAPGGRQAKGLGLVVELTPGETGFGMGCAPHRINAHPLHQGQVDRQPAVADAGAGEAVGTAAYGDQQVVVTSEVHGAEDVGHPDGAADQTWPPVDIRVPDLASLVIGGIAGSDEWAAQALLERVEGCCWECDLPAGERRRS